MNTHETPHNQKHRRLTIGYFSRPLHSDTGMRIWRGVVARARAHDVNLICVIGGEAFSPTRRLVYDLMTPQRLDGIVTWASSENTELDGLYERFRDVPLVSITLPLPGRPVVTVDGYPGMYDAVSHLIEVHRRRKLVFIAGPAGHRPAQVRYRAYVDALAAHQIPLDPVLVIPNNPWSMSLGELAIQRLCDEMRLQPGRDFDAVVTVNDLMARGALDTLRVRKVAIPDDVAVVGFNNSMEARSATPPMTSVGAPFQEQGECAVELVVALCRGEDVPQQLELPARLEIRESCSCRKSYTVPDMAVSQSSASEETMRQALKEVRPAVLRAISQTVESIDSAFAAGWAERLFDAFIMNVVQEESDEFLARLNGLIWQAGGSGLGVLLWHEVLSAMRTRLLPLYPGPLQRQAENLWRQAHVLISHTAVHMQLAAQYQARQKEKTLRNFGKRLLTTFHVAGLIDVLADGLSTFGIARCYLALYEFEGASRKLRFPDPALPRARLMLAYGDHGRIPLEPDGRRFQSQDLLPDDVWPQDGAFHFVLEPLCFAEEQLGFVFFDIGPLDGKIYEKLQSDLSAALQGALLVQRVQEHSAFAAHLTQLASAYQDEHLLAFLERCLKEECD